MILTGAVVNALAVFAGSAVGLLLKKGFPERMGDSIMKGLSLCVIYIGISGAFEGENVLIAIVSMAGGTVIGELLNLNERMEQLGEWIQNKFQSKDSKVSVAEGFVTSSLLFCTGAMTIVGSLQSGLSLDHSTLFAKSLIDGIAAVVLASSLGFGVLFAGIFCLVYEGGLALCAQFIGPFLTDSVIHEMTCVGSLLIIGVAINMLFKNKICVMNSIPAVFLPILLCRFM
ncbi:DUF554 domain-containing protein [Candidatus Merdisoma sp. JLR.KK011]|uniref:DUF554 domain-containing protein n=1 Tax=Candidatus Merdisoma sp. JLR.KK011 TaxID=3114299 RepID=UPI002FEF403D